MDKLIIIRGGGDLATGTIYKLYQSHYQLLILETNNPSSIRRHVSFSEAVYQGSQCVEGITCYLANTIEEAKAMLEENKLVMLVDPQGRSIDVLRPRVIIDAIISKKNNGTNKQMAPLTIALGPGYYANKDVDYVIETKRGHQLGRIIKEGEAIKNTGIPGIIAGYGKERVIHSPAKGIMKNINKIGDTVKKGDIIAYVDDIPVEASLDGLLRGIIRDGYPVTKGFKIADIDPRLEEYHNCWTISDKARCIAGGVLEVLLHEGVLP